MSTSQDLVAAVRERAAGQPYVIEETPDGFDVQLDLHPQWFGLLRERRLGQVSIHHVRVDQAAQTVTVTDELRTLSWVAGPDGRERPTLGAALEVSSGRSATRGFQRTYSVGGGGLTQESQTTWDTAEGRDLVVDTVTALGWKLERSLNEKIGLYVGVGTIVLLVLAGMVIGIVALAGGFS